MGKGRRARELRATEHKPTHNKQDVTPEEIRTAFAVGGASESYVSAEVARVLMIQMMQGFSIALKKGDMQLEVGLANNIGFYLSGKWILLKNVDDRINMANQTYTDTAFMLKSAMDDGSMVIDDAFYKICTQVIEAHKKTLS
jgi:hypothetical protein